MARMLVSNSLGLPYMGSKNAIAIRIVRKLPKAKRLYDLFAGGCAVTHAAMLSGKWEQYIINDISDSVVLFDNAVHGKYKDENRWISREDFFLLKDSDPYVRYVWSFGNKGTSYMYAKEIEEAKHALHDIHFAKNDEERRDAIGRYYAERKNVSEARLLPVESLQRLQRLQRLQSLQRLQRLQSDYRQVEILEDSVIYCDPPYKGTAEYVDGGFDHDAFYQWCIEQTAPLFISEYSMPSNDFVCIAEFRKTSLLRNGNIDKRKIVIEKLYRPKRQITG